jgi:hypothetical protein
MGIRCDIYVRIRDMQLLNTGAPRLYCMKSFSRLSLNSRLAI